MQKATSGKQGAVSDVWRDSERVSYTLEKRFAFYLQSLSDVVKCGYDTQRNSEIRPIGDSLWPLSVSAVYQP